MVVIENLQADEGEKALMATLTPDDENDDRSLNTDDDTSMDTQQRDVDDFKNLEGNSQSANEDRTFRDDFEESEVEDDEVEREVGVGFTKEEYRDIFLQSLDEVTLPTVNSLDPMSACYRLSNSDLQDRLTNDFG